MKAIINGITMAFDDTGSGLPLVLIHGFPLCRQMWHPQMNKIPAAGYRLITPDLRGFGESDAPEGPYSMDIFADDIMGLLDHLRDFLIYLGGLCFAVGSNRDKTFREKPGLMSVFIGHQSQEITHAIFRDHGSGNVGSPLQVVLGPCGDFSENLLLRNPTSQQNSQAVQELRTSH